MTPLLLVLLCIPLDVDGSTPVECSTEGRARGVSSGWAPANEKHGQPRGKGQVALGLSETREGQRPVAAGIKPGHSAGVEASTSIPLLVYGGSALADYLSTRHALDAGAVERNPLMRGNRLVVMKAAQVLALTYLDVELQRRGMKGKAKALRIGAAVVGGALALHNWRVANAQRRTR